ncbi:hypothetical protein [Shewanella indica]|jgi:hypothetical protein|uniref:hypothetical protein n=1 Tax=Shewanella indica TaxID=768528 RepID=UPI003004915B
MNFDPHLELEKLQTQTAQIRKSRYAKSRLDRFKGELLLLHREGATTAQLQRWLRSNRIKVTWSTVHRWLAKNG